MIIDCIADIHGFEPKLPGGDVLILAGDYTAADKMTQWGKFFEWLKKQPYQKKVLIAGNHDGFFESSFPKTQKEADDFKEIQEFLIEIGQIERPDFEYLCDSGTELMVNGSQLKIWGTPWTPLFHGVNPKCTAFMLDESKLDEKFKCIPNDIDILISHGPMRHMLDSNYDGYACGSFSLKKHIDRVKPLFFICGHIHEQGGSALNYKHDDKVTWCVNCSYVNEKYKPVNSYFRIEI